MSNTSLTTASAASTSHVGHLFEFAPTALLQQDALVLPDEVDKGGDYLVRHSIKLSIRPCLACEILDLPREVVLYRPHDAFVQELRDLVGGASAQQ